MKFTITANLFKQTLKIVEAVLPKRTSLPAALHVKLAVIDQKLTLTATNLKSLVHYSIPIESGTNGIAVVPAKKLLEFVKTLGTEPVTAELDTNTGRVLLISGRIRLTLPTLSAEEFPESKSESGDTFKVAQSVLHEALRLTAFATTREDDPKYILNGCGLFFDGGFCNLVATDSRRLAKFQFNPVEAPKHPELVKFIIPREVAEVLQDHLVHEETVTIVHGTNKTSLAFTTPTGHSYYFHFSLLEGDFPDVRKHLIVDKSENTINREALLTALTRAENVLDADGRVFFKFSPDQLDLEAKGMTVTNASHSCDLTESLAVNYKGSPVTACFRPKYIIEALERLDSEEVNFAIVKADTPLILTATDYIYLTLPMRI